MNSLWTLVLAALGILLIIGCSPEAEVPAGHEEVVFLSKDDLKAKMDAGEDFKLVDVLSAESYEAEHIRGAISIPYQTMEEQAPKMLEMNETVVVYCASYSCLASTEAAKKLMEMGYTNVLDYKGGIKEWKEAGLPIARGNE